MTDAEHSDERRANVAIVIFAKDEEANIARIIEAVAGQTLSERRDVALAVYVVANGCVDRTAAFARVAASKFLEPIGVCTTVLDWAKPGKSRSWNRAIHDELPAGVNFILAIDADIRFANDNVLVALLDFLRATPEVEVVSGFPVKDTELKDRPTLIDRFSMSISRQTRHSGVINGSLYLARASCLREIWLPNETPGEDGFLNAMVMTKGFSQEPDKRRVAQFSTPTHYFEGHSPTSYFAHEKRMIVGTMINRWIFEYLHSLKLSEPGGPLIESLNRDDPAWVDKIVAARSVGTWLIPREMMFGRLTPKKGITWNYLLRLPALLLACALTIPPAIEANAALKKHGATALW